MGYGIKYVAFTMKIRKELHKSDDTCLKIMKEEINKEQQRRNKQK